MADIAVVREVKDEETEVKGTEGQTPPAWVTELAQTDFKNEQVYRFNLISNLIGIRMALEDLVDELRKAPVQRTMNMPVTPEMQMQAMKLLGIKPPGAGRTS